MRPQKREKGVRSILNVTELFHLYRDDVYRLAVSYTHSIQEAEDVCQSVFLKLLEQKHIQPGKEKSWLMHVTANQCRSLLRSSWWRTTTALDETLSVEPPEINDVLQAVMKLKPQDRVVIYLHYYEGYSVKEIGKLLKATPSAITTRLYRARQSLKESIKEAP